MPLRARLSLILLAWGMVLLVIWNEAPNRSSFLITPVKSLSSNGANPFYKEEVINTMQHLPMVHVASLVECGDGTLTACWYGGSGECEPDVQIYTARRSATQEAWSAPTSVMTREKAQRELLRPVKSLGNAVLLAAPENTLHLLFVSIAMGKWSGSQLNLATLAKPDSPQSLCKRLTLSPFFNFSELVRNRPVQLLGGGFCIPIYQEFLGKFPELLWWHDEGGTLGYRKSRIAGGCTSFQPSLIPLDPSRAIAVMRDYTARRRIFLSRSDNHALTWSKPEPTPLRNPDAGISGLCLSDGTLLLAYNDSVKDRSNLSLATSHDEGRTWNTLPIVQQQADSSFSYPFLLQTSDGLIQMAYTSSLQGKSKVIKMITFNEAWLRNQSAKAGVKTSS